MGQVYFKYQNIKYNASTTLAKISEFTVFTWSHSADLLWVNWRSGLSHALHYYICDTMVFCLFGLILYVPVNILSVTSGWDFIG